MILLYILFFTFLGSIASLAGAILFLFISPHAKTLSEKLISFAAGVLLGTAFFDLLPEAQEAALEANIFLSVFAGFVTFFFAENFIQLFHHHHEHRQKTPTQLILVGDGVHNFVDGVAIAVSFISSVPLGIATSFAVAAHEIPQEIADMSVLLTNGLSKKRALLYNFYSALTAFLGAILAFGFADLIEKNLYILLSITAGFFIYISASDLIPEIHENFLKNRKISQTAYFILGILTIFTFVQLFD